MNIATSQFQLFFLLALLKTHHPALLKLLRVQCALVLTSGLHSLSYMISCVLEETFATYDLVSY